MTMLILRRPSLVLLLCAAPALAQGAPPSTTTESKAAAAAHFQAGVGLAQRGALSEAVGEFEAAYAASPHYSVLYNIAQTEVARGRFVQAVVAFERYLATGGKEVSSDRRQAVLELIARLKTNIGALQLEVAAPERTRVWLDGTELRGEELARPVALSAGSHSLISASSGSEPSEQQVLIQGQATTKARIAAAEEPNLRDASLVVTCSTPDVSVSLDGKLVGRTPIVRPLLVASGQRRVQFSRIGYVTRESVVQLSHEGSANVDCGVKVEVGLKPIHGGTLSIRSRPPLARAVVDGVAFAGNVIPVGRHELLVEDEGFVPYRRTLFINAGHNYELDLVLRPTPAKLQRDRRLRARRQTLAYVLGGSGAALLLAGGSLALWNQGRFEALANEQSSTRNPDPNRVVAIQRIDDLSIGLATVGAGLVVASLWSYLAGDE